MSEAKPKKEEMKISKGSPHFKTDSWDGTDLLGRQNFADHLAQRIRNWQGNESLVIALYGPWGSGKSIVKEMILKSLRSGEAKSCPSIIEFNSWEWANHEQMTKALFKQIRLTLGKKDAEESSKRAAKLLKFYENYLAAVVQGLEGVSATLEKSLKAVVLVIFAISTSLQSQLLKWIVFTIAGIALILPVVKFSHSFLSLAARLHIANAEKVEKTLQELKKDVAECLQGLNQPILIVIDDVDRLSSDEIQILFQLIKANLNFPNIIYFLAFQKNIVEHALETTFQVDSGREYLKKIVHVGFDLPLIERCRVDRILRTNLEDVFKKHNIQFPQARADEVFDGTFPQMFTNLRDVYRYSDTLEFQLGVMTNANGPEIDCLDFALLESLRQFEEKVYQKLPESKFALLRQQEPFQKAPIESKPTAYEAAVTLLSDQASLKNKEIVKGVLMKLFPEPQFATSATTSAWQRDFRICNTSAFDKYFLLNIPTGATSKEEVTKLVSATESTEAIFSMLKQFYSEKRLCDALSYLESSASIVKFSNVPFLIAALSNLENDVELKRSELMVITSLDLSRWIVTRLLKSHEESKRAELLEMAIRQTKGVLLPVNCVSTDMHYRKENPQYCIFPEEAYPSLKHACLIRIHSWKETDVAKEHLHLSQVLDLWYLWEPEQSAAWIQKLILNEDGLLCFLRAYLSGIDSKTVNAAESLLIAAISLERFVPLDNLADKIKGFDLVTEESGLVQRFSVAHKAKVAHASLSKRT